MEVINLFNSKLVKTTLCSCPQRDGFELKNLIENLEIKNHFSFYTSSNSNGFVSDTFIRPPITIYIIFNQPINIDKIVIDAKVNAQISNGFIISSSIEPLKSFESNTEKFIKTFFQIAKIINDKNKSINVYEFLKRGKDHDTSVNKIFFSTKSSNYLSEATAISISIIKTLNSSSPCLKSVKIYGCILNKTDNLNFTCSSSQEHLIKRIKIPDEFLDDLTHEMMRMPVKLPSKKVIDQSTLDKYLAERKKNNEVERDPFTCVKFSSNYKPVIDEVLKSKIDKFLFEHQGYVFEFNEPEKEPSARCSEFKRKLEPETGDMMPKRLRNSSESTNLLRCNSCQNVKNDAKSFYEIQICKHAFCRFCIVAMKNKCRICQINFNNNQLINIDRNYLK